MLTVDFEKLPHCETPHQLCFNKNAVAKMQFLAIQTIHPQ